MKRSVRTALTALAVAGLAMTAAGCSVAEKAKGVKESAENKAVDAVDKTVNETYEVTYEVTGKGLRSIEYNGGGGKAMDPKLESVDRPTAPWTKTVTLKGIMPPAVTAIAVDAGGEVGCKITYKGKVIEEKSANGIAASAACVAVSPVAVPPTAK
ncbi:MmpS family transport accessory protein [Streptomyces sp. URMC 123]|uniref:MmpS family transport accessory protein n=1 Tax=Streptomyces sp. URMC 123 TaxID=3423403 RepID=UPI003F1A9136